jgi:hypothetical protein
MRELKHISPFLSSSSSLFFCWGWRNFSTAAVENVYSFEWGVSVTFRTRVFCPTKKTTKKWKRRKKCFFWLLLGCLGKYLEISRHDKLIMGEVSDTSFLPFDAHKFTHTHAHTIYCSIKMPSLPSPETTMTLAGVGMVRFIPTLLSFSFSFSE